MTLTTLMLTKSTFGPGVSNLRFILSEILTEKRTPRTFSTRSVLFNDARSDENRNQRQRGARANYLERLLNRAGGLWGLVRISPMGQSRAWNS